MMKSIGRGKRWISLMLFLFLCGMVFLCYILVTQSANYIARSGKSSYGCVYDRNGELLFDGRSQSDTAVSTVDMGNLIGDNSGQMTNTLIEKNKDLLNNYSFTGGYSTEGKSAVYTTLNHTANQKVYQAFGSKQGCAIAYNYQTGEILICTSLPNIDTSKGYENIAEMAEGTLLNKCFYSTVPGSTQKIPTLIAVTEILGTDAVSALSYNCQGIYTNAQGGQIKCHQLSGHGVENIQQAFANSCNSFYAQMLEQSGVPLDRLITVYEKMGYRINGSEQDTILINNIKCQSASTTLTDLSEFNTQWGCIGQGETLISPCQMMMWQSAIANESGKVTLPYLISDASNVMGEKKQIGKTEYGKSLFSTTTASYVKNIMLANGNNYSWKISGYTLGVKSGTAQVANGAKENSLLTGFVADSNFPIAFCVLIEDRTSYDISTESIVQVMLDALK